MKNGCDMAYDRWDDEHRAGRSCGPNAQPSCGATSAALAKSAWQTAWDLQGATIARLTSELVEARAQLEQAKRAPMLIVTRVLNALRPEDVQDGDEVEDAVRRVRLQRDGAREVLRRRRWSRGVLLGRCIECNRSNNDGCAPECALSRALGGGE